MLTIKNFFSLIALVAVVLFSNSNIAIAQAGASAETAEFVRAAKEAQEEIGLLLPAHNASECWKQPKNWQHRWRPAAQK